MKIYKKIYLYSNERYQEFELFEHNFAEKNKCKYKIICKNKMYPLQSILKFIENSNEELKIKIISYNHILGINKIFDYLPASDNYEIEKYKKNMNMYKFIEYLDYLSHKIQKIIYKIDFNDKIRIVGEEFLEINGNKCSVIYKDKIILFRSFFLFKDINKEDKKIKNLQYYY